LHEGTYACIWAAKKQLRLTDNKTTLQRLLLLSNPGTMEHRAGAAGMYNSTDSLRQHLQHSGVMSRPDITATADARDQQQQDLLRISMDLPITYMPFKFENRRVRMDWRLLHGVDIDKLVSGRPSLGRPRAGSPKVDGQS
jgi:hypothetical protein